GEIARDGGCIDFLGRTVARPRLHQLAPAGLFYLPERGLLTGSATAGERFSTLTRRYALAATDSVIAALRLDDLLDRTAAEMSTGERRRAELGLVLTRRPLCLL